MTKRDISRLVRVQRTVTRKGRTYQQFYYVKPADVKATDIVIGNKRVLDEYRRVKAQGVGTNETFDMAKFEVLRYSGDREEAFKYIEACGIQWKKCSHPGIDWMRMIMAVDKKTNGELKRIIRRQTNKGVISYKKDSIYKAIDNAPNFNSLSGKQKLRIIKQAVNYNDLPELAGLLDVKWKASTDYAINNMRVQVALAKTLDILKADSLKKYLDTRLNKVDIEVQKKVEAKKKAEEEAKKKAEEEKKKKEEEERKKKEEEEAKKKAETEANAEKAIKERVLSRLQYISELAFDKGSPWVKTSMLLSIYNAYKEKDNKELLVLCGLLGLKPSDTTEAECEHALIDYFGKGSPTLYQSDSSQDITYKKFMEKLGLLKPDEDTKEIAFYPDSDEAKIKIPKDAPERKKNIINLINRITSTKDLHTIIDSGIIPEDDKAKAYVENISESYHTKLGIKEDSGNNFTSADREIAMSSVNKGKLVKKLVGDYNIAVPGVKTSDRFKGYAGSLQQVTTEGFMYSMYTDSIEHTLPFNILRKRADADSLCNELAVHDDGLLMQTNSQRGVVNRNNYSNKLGLGSTLDILQSSFGNYDSLNTNKDHVYRNNIEASYTAWDYSAKKPEDMGVVRVLNHIISSLGKDYEAEGKEVLDEYLEAVKVCGNVPKVLNFVTDYTDYASFEEDRANLQLKNEVCNAFNKLFDDCKLTDKERRSLEYSMNKNSIGSSMKYLDLLEVTDGTLTAKDTFTVYADGGFGVNNTNGRDVHFTEEFIQSIKDAVNKYDSVVTNKKHNILNRASDLDTLITGNMSNLVYDEVDTYKRLFYSSEAYKANATQVKVDALNKVDKSKFDSAMKHMLNMQGVDLYLTNGTEFTKGERYIDKDNFSDSIKDYLDAVDKNPYGDPADIGTIAIENMYSGEKARKRSNIIGNLHYIKDKTQLEEDILEGCNSAQASTYNDSSRSILRQFNYYSPRHQRNFSLVTDDGKLVLDLGMDDKAVTPKEFNDKIKEQLNNTSVLSESTLKHIASQVEHTKYAKINLRRNVSNVGSGEDAYTIGNYTDENLEKSAYYDAYIDTLAELASYSCKSIKKKKGVEIRDPQVGRDFIYKKFNFKSYDARLAEAQETADRDFLNADKVDNPLKKLRLKAYNKAHCSLSQVKDKSVENYITKHWDTDGTALDPTSTQGYPAGSQLKYSYIKPNYITGAYQINNSDAEDRLQNTIKKTGEKAHTFFHGTDKVGGCGIIGVDGEFRFSGDAVNGKGTGSMLGKGIYVADCAGKSSGYFANWGAGYTDGALLVCDAVLGKYAVEDGTGKGVRSTKADSVIMTAGTSLSGNRRSLRANEWCLRSNDLIAPKYIVDMGAKNK